MEQALEDAVAELDLRERRLASLEQENKEAIERYTAKVNNARSAHDLELMELKGAHAAQLESELAKAIADRSAYGGNRESGVQFKVTGRAKHQFSVVREVRVTELLGTVKQLEGQKATLVLELSSLQATYASQKEAFEEEHGSPEGEGGGAQLGQGRFKRSPRRKETCRGSAHGQCRSSCEECVQRGKRQRRRLSA